MDISVHKKVSRLVDITVFPFFSLESLHGRGEYLYSVHFKVIRTLPHISEFLLRLHTTVELPVYLILRPEDERLSRIILCAGALEHIVCPAFFPDFRIPYMEGQI